MPRIAAKKKEARAPDKLDLILNALLTRPETCMVGEGCGCAAFGGEALVESLALFLAHGDGSKRLFAARGGKSISQQMLPPCRPDADVPT